MQRPIEEIEKAKAFLQQMKKDLRYMQNPLKRDFHIDALNSFIIVINLFESFLKDKYKLEAVEGLLIARIYSMFYGAILDDGQICIARVVQRIEDDIDYPKCKKQELINFLFAESAVRSLENKEKITSEQEWIDLVDNLLTGLKRRMMWS